MIVREKVTEIVKREIRGMLKFLGGYFGNFINLRLSSNYLGPVETRYRQYL